MPLRCGDIVFHPERLAVAAEEGWEKCPNQKHRGDGADDEDDLD